MIEVRLNDPVYEKGLSMVDTVFALQVALLGFLYSPFETSKMLYDISE